MNEKLVGLALDFREAARARDEASKRKLIQDLRLLLPGLTDEELQKAALTIAADTFSRS